jgi:hypothetical protein
VPTRIRAGDKGDRLGDGSVYLGDSQIEEDIEEELERSRPAVAFRGDGLAGAKYVSTRR